MARGSGEIDICLVVTSTPHNYGNRHYGQASRATELGKWRTFVEHMMLRMNTDGPVAMICYSLRIFINPVFLSHPSGPCVNDARCYIKSTFPICCDGLSAMGRSGGPMSGCGHSPFLLILAFFCLFDLFEQLRA